ncbi:MAG: GMC family oxidoreductase [Nitrosopumilus sp.]|nr:GMC family oxidoreductase [Nitrosopumilus sp.]MDH3736054.1 GMC family oxidoreductase [Nitrosopumilus sp.]MDH3823225.1 GMC family oxidoreductase [Nitrosopumilus sp.]MDH3833619.1 GMC family oxidoreductase [Nitrosopumilus sp.]
MTNTIFGISEFEKRAEIYKVIQEDIVRNVDVCVIGSGAAGAIIAEKLAAAGKSVVLLEKGGYYDGESMNQQENDMISLLWKNSGANFTSNLKIAIAQGSCLGGSTVINDAVCFRIPEIVIKQWNDLGVNITKEEWDYATDEVSARINVTKVTDEELNENAKKLQKACTTIQVNGEPITEHRVNDRNCGPSWTDPTLQSCVQCGFCHLGCHYDTKQSMLVTYIHDALQSNNDFTAYCDCDIKKIIHKDGIVTGVEGSFIDNTGNEKYRIRVNAKLVVVSAGAIASSNILHKSGVANKNIGQGLALHPAPFVIGHFNEKIYGNRGIPMSYTCHQFGVTNNVKQGGFLIESIFLPIFQMALAIPSFGLDHARLMAEFNNYALAGIMTRDDSVGRILKTFGDNPKVEYELTNDTINDMARGMAILARMWFEIGADYVIGSHSDVTEIRSAHEIPKLEKAIRDNPDGLRVGSAHPQGGNKMGDDPEKAVVDSNCKVFGFKNLYCSDASVFPTSLGVNPQLTVMALGTLTADKIIANWPSDIAVLDSLGNTCDLSQPENCLTETLGEMFAVTEHKPELFEKLENSESKEIIPGDNWQFDKNKLKISNNLYWKGFYGRNADLMTTGLRAFGGFYKRFRKLNSESFSGVTKPFNVPVFAKSLAKEKELAGHGKIIHLEYQAAPFNQAYDILKMVDENNILGKAFMGRYGRGQLLFDFSMSKIYHINFMGEDDLATLFYNDQYSHTPTKDEMIGKWEGMLVSDSFVTPRSQVFDFDYDGSGEYQMHYNFSNLLQGYSEVSANEDLFRFDDFTPFHDELRMIRPDFAVGKWVINWSLPQSSRFSIEELQSLINSGASTIQVLDSIYKIFNLRISRLPQEIGISFLNVENHPQKGSRIGLSYILRKTN